MNGISLPRQRCPGFSSQAPVLNLYSSRASSLHSAHSMRAAFITTALENGAQLKDVQKAAGHRNPGTTKLYDRRGYNPEKAASFFATY
jgi:site-specific recombinase XerD